MTIYNRKEKESFLLDVVGYSQEEVSEMDMDEINEIIKNNQQDFNGYMQEEVINL